MARVTRDRKEVSAETRNHQRQRGRKQRCRSAEVRGRAGEWQRGRQAEEQWQKAVAEGQRLRGRVRGAEDRDQSRG